MDFILRSGTGELEVGGDAGEGKVKNTIDLITVMLESWGRGRVEVLERQRRTNGQRVREYTILINKNNTIWNKIYDSNVKICEFSFNLTF